MDAIVLSLLLSEVTVSCHPYALFGSFLVYSVSFLVTNRPYLIKARSNLSQSGRSIEGGKYIKVTTALHAGILYPRTHPLAFDCVNRRESGAA